MCVCNGGFTGTHCETPLIFDFCTPNPCQNGGSCTRLTDGFNCSCIKAFKGSTCDVSKGNGFYSFMFLSKIGKTERLLAVILFRWQLI